jgi:hypothetical protein
VWVLPLTLHDRDADKYVGVGGGGATLALSLIYDARAGCPPGETTLSASRRLTLRKEEVLWMVPSFFDFDLFSRCAAQDSSRDAFLKSLF